MAFPARAPLCLALAVAAVAVTSELAAASTADSASYFSRLNAERADHGLARLAMSADLSAVAQTWADHMAASGVLSHNPDLTGRVSDWQAVGENVGDGPSIADLDAAFMASPTHRHNILDPSYEQVGVGTVDRNGVIWISVVFRDPMHAVTATASRSEIRRSIRPRRAVGGPAMLAIGSSGAAVAHVQRRLRVRADGVFGPITRRAVMSFQRAHRLVVDGVVGPRTLAALRTARVTATLTAAVDPVAARPSGSWRAVLA